MSADDTVRLHLRVYLSISDCAACFPARISVSLLYLLARSAPIMVVHNPFSYSHHGSLDHHYISVLFDHIHELIEHELGHEHHGSHNPFTYLRQHFGHGTHRQHLKDRMHSIKENMHAHIQELFSSHHFHVHDHPNADASSVLRSFVVLRHIFDSSCWKALSTDLQPLFEAARLLLDSGKVLSKLLEEVSEIHPFVKPVVHAFIAIVKSVSQRKENDVHMDAIMNEVYHTLGSLTELKRFNKSQHIGNTNHRSLEEQLNPHIKNFENFLKDFGFVYEVYSQLNKAGRTVTSLGWSTKFKEFKEQFKHHREVFQHDMIMHLLVSMEDMKSVVHEMNNHLLEQPLHMIKEDPRSIVHRVYDIDDVKTDECVHIEYSPDVKELIGNFEQMYYHQSQEQAQEIGPDHDPKTLGHINNLLRDIARAIAERRNPS